MHALISLAGVPEDLALALDTQGQLYIRLAWDLIRRNTLPKPIETLSDLDEFCLDLEASNHNRWDGWMCGVGGAENGSSPESRK